MSATPTREQLLHWLAEAAELEHNLLCSYLFALFSLKQGTDEDLTPAELEAVTRWRKALLGVCIEEMAHLAQVANLTVALGGRPHFDRPNLPIAAGYHPGSIAIELVRFDRDTLDHFIYLERPADASDDDGASYARPELAVPRDTRLALSPSGLGYDTIGEFYDALRDGLASYVAAHGERRLFIGPEDLQMHADEIGGAPLHAVTNLAQAQAAIEEIVRQGEGGHGAGDDSHYAQFQAMRDEFNALRRARPGFDPARAVARNPVMRPPVEAERCHVTAPDAVALIDVANSLYALMLRCLGQLYETPRSATAARQAIGKSTFGCMKAFSIASSALTRRPATLADGSPMAGVSFSVPRHTEGAASPRCGAALLTERCREIHEHVTRLETAAPGLADALQGLRASIEAFEAAPLA